MLFGPRLVGTPQMKNAHDWAVKNYEKVGDDLPDFTSGVFGEVGKEALLTLTC